MRVCLINARRKGALSGRRSGLLVLASCLVAGWLVAGAAVSVAAEPRDFGAWLQALRAEALARGVREPTLDSALTGLDRLPRVVELDRRQPEVTLTYAMYMARVVTAGRVRDGARLLAEHRDLLREIGTRYGVPPSLIVALWGAESDFGRSMGDFPAIAALATLAFEGRRGAFFRRELLDALALLDEGAIRPEAMVGSWAGAMGPLQFMPSSVRRYAVDYDGDGRRDVWATLADAFASAANYLAHAGWRAEERWGHRVRLPRGVGTTARAEEPSRSLAAWRVLGVLRADGRELPDRADPASLLLPGGPTGPVFLVQGNYRTLLAWNPSTHFALAVGQLADLLDPR